MEDNMSSIINNFKDMLENSKSKSNDNSKEKSENNSSNFNITPDMIKNLSNILQNSKGTEKSDNNKNSINSDKAEPSSFTQNNTDNFSSTIDFETILKLKTIMDTLNKKDDPRSNLLYSLKPYLREPRQKKLDQYVNLFKITQVTNLFKNKKGDGI